MTSTADVQERIEQACRTIAAMWPAMHQTSSTGSFAARTPARALFSHDVDDEATDDLPRLDVLIDTRARVAARLNGWARILVEERDLTHGLPDGHDGAGLARLIERHAAWWSGHVAARDIVDELGADALELRNAVFPHRRDRVRIGACTWCGEDVWAKPGADVVTCRACGCSGGVAEWADAIGGLPLVTLPGLGELLHRRMGMRVTVRTLQRWYRDGVLARHVAFGPQPLDPPRVPVFDPIVAMRAVASMYRACPMCGVPWAGSGWECLRCRMAAPTKPTKARRVASLPVPSLRAPAPVAMLAPEVEVALKANRCEQTGLPSAWCACGWCETAC